MNSKKTKLNQRDRFLKLSLRKNKVVIDETASRLNRSSDVIILDDSFDRLKSEFPTQVFAEPTVYSPIVVEDSSELSSEDLPHVSLAGQQSDRLKDLPHVSLAGQQWDRLNTDNASYNSTGNVSIIEISDKESGPSMGGWSPSQNILCATPKHQTIPTTPQDVANTSLEQCSLKKIEQSHKKVLDDLYGDAWKSISTKKLFKTLKNKFDNFDHVSKKLQFNEDEESDKENIRNILDTNKKLYLTGSDAKHKKGEFGKSEKKSKKKLYTEKIAATPDVPKQKTVRAVTRNVNTTGKKKKPMSVTELVSLMGNNFDLTSKNDDNFDSSSNNTELDSGTDTKSDFVTKNTPKSDLATKNTTKTDLVPKNITKEDLVSKTNTKNDWVMKNKTDFNLLTNDINSVTKTRKDIDWLTRKIDEIANISEKKTPENAVRRLSFIASLADNVPTWRCHIEALQYHDHYKSLHKQLSQKLYMEFNKHVFGDQLDADMIISWDSKLRSTAGTTTNRLVKTSSGDRIRTSSIKLSSKVVDGPQRLRDTMIHEMCHAATWLVDGEIKAGHGPLWKKWATRALCVYPELGQISRCHNLEIYFKYTFKCRQCGYSIQRHSKSVDVTKKCCGYCRGTFETIVNRKKKDGVIVSTPARKGGTNEFALFVKENYANFKNGRTHAQVMKVLGEQFSNRKK